MRSPRTVAAPTGTIDLDEVRVIRRAKNGDVDAFEKWLSTNDKVERIVSKPQRGEGLATVQIDMNGDVREALLPEIAAAGFGLRLVEAPEDELEEIFLGLTHQEAA